MANWDERYERGEHTNDAPHSLVVRIASGLPPGRALDIASGPGRHAIWLAQRGWQVTAVDKSTVAIDMLRHRSAEKGVSIDSRIADLENHELVIASEFYDLIVVCNYLQRDLFPVIKKGVCVGGVVIAIIAISDDDLNIRPMNPDYLLNAGELRTEFREWELLWDFEGKPGTAQRATAQIAARRPAAGALQPK